VTPPFQGWTFRDGMFGAGADVSASDRALRWGMSVFETVAIYDGRPLFLEDHLRRLELAVFAAGGTWRAVGLIEAVRALVASASLDRGNLRLYALAGPGGVETPFAAEPILAIFEAMPFPGADEVTKGLRVGISRAPLPSVLGGWKTGNYWMHVQTLAHARRQGLDEALVFDWGGALVSAAMANVCLRLEGHWHTPPRSSGARDGVVLAWVRRHRDVEEAALDFEAIARADEIFLTNSRLGVMPVAEIDGRLLPSQKAGGELAALYREEILRA